MTEKIVRDTFVSDTHAAAQPDLTPASGAADDISSTHVEGAQQLVEPHQDDLDAASDKATAAFIRRTLCSHSVLLSTGEKGRSSPRPIEEVLPPLTSSNAVDLQLYAIISVIIKEFVQTWYSKITPDQDFIHEVIQVIAHCTRGLEQRLRKVDLEALIFDEIPELLENHLTGRFLTSVTQVSCLTVHSTAYRLAKKEADNPTSLVSDIRFVYHTIHPHPALSPVPSQGIPSSFVEQRENESAWRQLLVQGLLAVLLPTEDLENGCLRSLVAEIFAEMILGNGISGKACEGWLLWEGITRIAEVLHKDHEEEEIQSGNSTEGQSLSSLERYGLLSTPFEGQSDIAKPPSPTGQHHAGSQFLISGAFWAVIQYVFLVFSATRTLVIGVATSSSLPSRSVTSVSISSPIEADYQWASLEAEQPAAGRPVAFKRPLVDMKLWSCASQIVEMQSRMPWLSGFISMLHWVVLAGPGRVGDTNGVLDR